MRVSIFAFLAVIAAVGVAGKAEASRYYTAAEVVTSGTPSTLGVFTKSRTAERGYTSRSGSNRASASTTSRSGTTRRTSGTRVASLGTSTSVSSGRHSAGARPRQWCGWWMRTQRGGGPELNVAWNWSKWGRSSGPQVGAVVVWRHHVGEIVGRASNGQWLVRSGNDGGSVRTRARSVAGAVFRVG